MPAALATHFQRPQSTDNNAIGIVFSIAIHPSSQPSFAARIHCCAPRLRLLSVASPVMSRPRHYHHLKNAQRLVMKHNNWPQFEALRFSISAAAAVLAAVASPAGCP